jgi:hypothetical protein
LAPPQRLRSRKAPFRDLVQTRSRPRGGAQGRVKKPKALLPPVAAQG